VARDTVSLSLEEVWAALGRIPDPEIPVISLVELGIVTEVEVAGDRVDVELTPTFLGCPALEAMTSAIRVEVASLGAEVDVHVRTDREWSTDRITPEGREKLRTAGFAPPAPRRDDGPTLVQLQRSSFRCPWCDSTDTKLENVFGPPPCRSIRYCNACRQPFEQFKTI
jgi:ring-1,2-phenylacetyl-CoA epoxidase subunit PaaD